MIYILFFFFQGLNLKRLEAVQGGREVRKSEGEGEGRRESAYSVAVMWWVMVTDDDDNGNENV